MDANQGYTVSDAVRTLKAFEELGVEAVEQCLPSWDLDGMRFVRSKVDLKVMLDESVHTPSTQQRPARSMLQTLSTSS